MTLIQAWELVYRQAQLKFDQVRDWQSPLEEIPTEILVFTLESLEQMDFSLRY
jgi:hypothetical protein